MILTARHYRYFTLSFIAFVAYASLVPLKFAPRDWADGWAHFLGMMQAPIGFQSKSDWVSNVLLFIPLGFGMMAALNTDRAAADGSPRRLRGVAVVLPFCTLLSAGIELAQVWFPPRHTSPNDVIAESVGGLVGVVGYAALGPWLTQLGRDLWAEHGQRNWAVRLLPGYLLVLVLLHAAPFDITISPGEIMQKYREGRIRPLPFAFQAGDKPLELIEKTAFNIGYFLPAGVLLAAIRLPGGGSRFGLWRVLLLGGGLAAGVEFMQVFIASHFADATDVLTGLLGVYLGWCLHRLNASAPSTLNRTLRFTSLVFWSVLLVTIHWFPFDFRSDAGFLESRGGAVNAMPFLEYQSGNYLNSFNQILRKTLLFVPLGILLERRGPALLLGLAFAALIEAGQFFLPDRFPTVTDPLIETAGAVAGATLARRLHQFTTGPTDAR